MKILKQNATKSGEEEGENSDDKDGTHHLVYTNKPSCMFTIENIPLLLSHLWNMNFNGNNIGTKENSFVLGHHNVRKHNFEISDELEHVIHSKYSMDMKMWEEVTNEENQGILCV